MPASALLNRIWRFKGLSWQWCAAHPKVRLPLRLPARAAARSAIALIEGTIPPVSPNPTVQLATAVSMVRMA